MYGWHPVRMRLKWGVTDDLRGALATLRLAFAAALSTAVILGAVACGDGTQNGAALFQSFATSIGAKPIRPGVQIGLLYYDVYNKSSATISIDSVSIAGRGVGTVVRVVQIKMAPLRYGLHDDEPHSVPAALYTTNPPVFFEGSICRKQALVPVRAFRLTPGSVARMWIVLRAMRPGKWVIPAHVIYYSQGPVRYKQTLAVRAYGSVADGAPYIPPDWATAKCVIPEGAAYLPGYRAP